MTIGPLIPHLGLINATTGGSPTGPSAPTDDGAFADAMRGLAGDPQEAADQFNEGGFFANADAVETPTLAVAAPTAATPAAAAAVALPVTPPLSAADLLAARDALPAAAEMATTAVGEQGTIPVDATPAPLASPPFAAPSGEATTESAATPRKPPLALVPVNEPAAPAHIRSVALVTGGAARSPIEAKIDARDGAATVTVAAPGLTDQEVEALRADIVALLRRHGLVLDDLRLNGRSTSGGQDRSGN